MMEVLKATSACLSVEELKIGEQMQSVKLFSNKNRRGKREKEGFYAVDRDGALYPCFIYILFQMNIGEVDFLILKILLSFDNISRKIRNYVT